MRTRVPVLGSVLIVAVMLAASSWAWFALPADVQLPVHWDFQGEVDRRAGKLEALLLAPAVAILLSVLFLVWPRIEPRRTNLERSQTAYVMAWLGTLLALAGGHLYILSSSPYNLTDNVPRFAVAGGGLLCLLLGLALPRTHSNWIMGVRTPWTMSSEDAWRKSNGLAGQLFAALGILVIALVPFLPPTVPLFLLLGGTVIIALVVIPYSYVAWRADASTDHS